MIVKKDFGKKVKLNFLLHALKIKSTYLARFEKGREMQKNSNTSNYPLRYYVIVKPKNGEIGW